MTNIEQAKTCSVLASAVLGRRVGTASGRLPVTFPPDIYLQVERIWSLHPMRFDTAVFRIEVAHRRDREAPVPECHRYVVEAQAN